MLKLSDLRQYFKKSRWLLTTGSGVQIPPDQLKISPKKAQNQYKKAFLGLFLFLSLFSSFYRLNTTKYYTLLFKCEHGVNTFHINRQEFNNFRNHNALRPYLGFSPGCGFFISTLP